MVGSNITSFNISGLAASTGTGEGTILEFDSSGNIIPSVGTYNMVSKIDTKLSSLQSSVTTNTSDINTLLSGGTLFTMSGSYTVPSNVTTLTIEAIGGGGGGAGSGSGSSSTGPWSGGGGGSSRCLQKITIPVASGQVIDFTIGSGGSGGAPKSGGSNGGTTTISMYGQSILTCAGGLGSTGINRADGPSSAGVTCSGGGGMGYFQCNLAGTGGSRTFPGSNSTIYEVDDPSSESGNGGLNYLGQAVMPGFTSGLGGAGGSPNLSRYKSPPLE